MSDFLGYGTKFEVYVSSAFTAVFAQPTKIDPPAIKQKMISSYNYASSGNVLTKVAGSIDPGTVDVAGFYVASEYSTISGLMGTLQQFRIVFNDLTSSDYSGVTFYGYVTDLQIKTPLEGLDQTEFKIEISGPVTWSSTITTP